MISSTKTNNLQKIRRNIEAAAKTACRDPNEIKLLAVSKKRALEEIQPLYQAGQRMFGENRIQELLDKIHQLPTDIEWHLIGHLQKNKVRQAIKTAAWIHSVDSIELVERIERIAAEEQRRPKILLQINVSGEETKFGMEPSLAAGALKTAVSAKHIDVVGLMTMAPFASSGSELHEIFAGLRRLRDRLESEFNHPLPELSMGMSGDYETAIAEGATIVRIGTALFE